MPRAPWLRIPLRAPLSAIPSQRSTATTRTSSYSLTGGDTELFDINKSTGQLSVAEGANLDFESKSTYSVSRAGQRRRWETR